MVCRGCPVALDSKFVLLLVVSSKVFFQSHGSLISIEVIDDCVFSVVCS